MGSTTHSIEVNAPIRAVYNQWTQFEDFPRFMDGVEEVRQERPNRLFWRATIGGKDKQWEAEIVEQVPDQRIAWVSTDGTPNAGEVNFESLDVERTLITLTMQYEPEGLLEKAGDLLGIPSSHVQGNLQRFREFIEQMGSETGGWRGRIGGETSDSAPDAVRQEEKGGSLYGTHAGTGAVAPRETGLPKTIHSEETERGTGSETGGWSGRIGGETLESAPDVVRQEEQGESLYGAHAGTGAVAPRETGLPETIDTEKNERGTHLVTAEREDLAPGTEHSSRTGDGQADEPSPLDTERVAAEEVPQFYRNTTAPTREQIARRAYEIHLTRGGSPGDPEQDWLQAEKELSENVDSR
ncbi:MAG: DUF2934 domain-containing protein [Verrucomicrobia bacterium]|nr:DUF2934 domain-containing protein [Verrucomicrobiota bacterium]